MSLLVMFIVVKSSFFFAILCGIQINLLYTQQRNNDSLVGLLALFSNTLYKSTHGHVTVATCITKVLPTN